jgi:hypothetical protein
MAVHRTRKRGPRPGSLLDTGKLLATTGSLGIASGDLGAAAEIIADEARRLAAAWSVQIPASIAVRASEHEATISTSAGPAYPAETRHSHPLFGDRSHWYGPPGEPFLRPAADAKAGAALARYAKKIDRWCRDAGFK